MGDGATAVHCLAAETCGLQLGQPSRHQGRAAVSFCQAQPHKHAMMLAALWGLCNSACKLQHCTKRRLPGTEKHVPCVLQHGIAGGACSTLQIVGYLQSTEASTDSVNPGAGFQRSSANVLKSLVGLHLLPPLYLSCYTRLTALTGLLHHTHRQSSSDSQSSMRSTGSSGRSLRSAASGPAGLGVGGAAGQLAAGPGQVRAAAAAGAAASSSSTRGGESN
jgi:hypothetical protein